MSKLILVGGLPGSGKTFIGKALARRIGAAYLDKDVVANGFVAALLVALGSHPADRESPVYVEHVRPLEYQTLLALGLDSLTASTPVVCSAPFLAEFGSQPWLERVRADAQARGASLLPLWVRSDLETVRDRIVRRGEARDSAKLRRWDEYASTVSIDPPDPGIAVIDNSNPFDWKVQLGRVLGDDRHA